MPYGRKDGKHMKAMDIYSKEDFFRELNKLPIYWDKVERVLNNEF